MAIKPTIDNVEKFVVKTLKSGNLDDLIQTWPPILARNKIGEHTGGLISKGTMQNLDSEGKGPKRIVIGRRCGYIREDFIEWLRERMV